MILFSACASRVPISITREEIKRFASEFDPQPYHLDETAAERRPNVVDRATCNGVLTI